MTIGDEKVVYQQRDLTRMDGGEWRDCSKAIFDRINDDRYVASETRALIPQSAYAELAAELATYKADTQKLREILGDSPAAKLVIELDTVRAEKKAAESQLAELRGGLVKLADHWLEMSKLNSGSYGSGIYDCMYNLRNLIRDDKLGTLAAADGATTGETKCPTP